MFEQSNNHGTREYSAHGWCDDDDPPFHCNLGGPLSISPLPAPSSVPSFLLRTCVSLFRSAMPFNLPFSLHHLHPWLSSLSVRHSSLFLVPQLDVLLRCIWPPSVPLPYFFLSCSIFLAILYVKQTPILYFVLLTGTCPKETLLNYNFIVCIKRSNRTVYFLAIICLL